MEQLLLQVHPTRECLGTSWHCSAEEPNDAEELVSGGVAVD